MKTIPLPGPGPTNPSNPDWHVAFLRQGRRRRRRRRHGVKNDPTPFLTFPPIEMIMDSPIAELARVGCNVVDIESKQGQTLQSSSE